jgi:hypothetical protein
MKKERLRPYGFILEISGISQWRARKFLFKLFVYDWDRKKT